MAKRVIWTARAQQDRKEILAFWVKHNQSTNFSRKLDGLLKEAIDFIKANPKIGKLTDIENVRIKVVRNYLIFYELRGNKIYILAVWDSRQDPDKLEGLSY